MVDDHKAEERLKEWEERHSHKKREAADTSAKSDDLRPAEADILYDEP